MCAKVPFLLLNAEMTEKPCQNVMFNIKYYRDDPYNIDFIAERQILAVINIFWRI